VESVTRHSLLNIMMFVKHYDVCSTSTILCQQLQEVIMVRKLWAVKLGDFLRQDMQNCCENGTRGSIPLLPV
jgi:hypothetical protein